MTGSLIGLLVELLVAVLLAITIGYCVLLNGRLKRLRADDADFRATISELVTATEIAERSIRELKATIADADRQLGDRLAQAAKAQGELQRLTEAADRTARRSASLSEAIRAMPPAPSAPPPPAARPTAAAPRQAFSAGQR